MFGIIRRLVGRSGAGSMAPKAKFRRLVEEMECRVTPASLGYNAAPWSLDFLTEDRKFAAGISASQVAFNRDLDRFIHHSYNPVKYPLP